MATEAIEQSETAAPPKKTGLIIMMAVAGIAVGGAAGMFALGPLLAKPRSATAPAAEKKAAAEPAPAAVIHAIENLVLNPAGTGGTRFLMVNATFELKDGAAEQLMKDHEAEVRDRILALLGKKSVDELTDTAMRDGIKTEVLAAVSPMFPKGAIRKVFFPQFVIQ